MTPTLNIVLRMLAIWRLSNMLVEEDGPGQILRKFRELTGIEHDKGGNKVLWNDYTPLYCVYCTSVWVAGALWFAPSWIIRLLALSGGAILIDVGESFVKKVEQRYLDEK